MYALVMTIHVVVCVFLIIVVLLQSGKAADLAGAFGGMGSQTAFGPRGSATLLSKATTISAGDFGSGHDAAEGGAGDGEGTGAGADRTGGIGTDTDRRASATVGQPEPD
jgi:preprotein translocase subunit SecG